MKTLGVNPTKKSIDDIKVLGLNKTHEDVDDVEDGGVVTVKLEGNGTTPVVITDVRAFKSGLQVSAGPQPVKHIVEFEELECQPSGRGVGSDAYS